MLSSTPWGQPQTMREIAPGISFYSTAGHGEYHLSPDRFETFRQFFPDYVLWAGDPWLRKIVTRHLSRSRSPQSSPIRVYFLRSKAYALASNVSELPILLASRLCRHKRSRRVGCTSNTTQRWRRALETLSRLSRKALLLSGRTI